MVNIASTVKNFDIKGEFIKWEKYGSGHINDTYAIYFVNDGDYRRYIMQRINHNIFQNVDGLMSNIVKVTDYLKTKIIEQGGNPDIECMNVVKTKDGKNYYYDGENYFRVYLFVEEGVSFQLIENPVHFYASGEAFGRFQKLLKGFDANELYDVIPNFHNTEDRINNLKIAIKNDRAGRAKEVEEEIKFYLDREKYASQVVSKLKTGEIPLRVTHNDTKLNNVLISQLSEKGVCVIDLDTVMSGSLLYDFGDSIRFGASTGEEDEKDLNKVNFSIELFETFTRGFLNGLEGDITEIEKSLLGFSGILMTYECGARFLTDYLNGDVYFRIHRPEHNLDRTRTQMKLVQDMEKSLEDINKLVDSIV